MADEPAVSVEGLRETLTAFRGLPKAASQALRERTLTLSATLAKDVASAGRADSKQAALMAPLVRARKDRIVSLRAGGAKKVGSNRRPAHKIVFGAEFGATQYPQFRPHKGKVGYWIFPTVRESDEIPKAWQKVADDIGEAFVRRGGL